MKPTREEVEQLVRAHPTKRGKAYRVLKACLALLDENERLREQNECQAAVIEAALQYATNTGSPRQDGGTK